MSNGSRLLLLTVAFSNLVSVASAQTSAADQSDSARTSSVATPDPRAVQPERPTVATHAYTVAPGYVEIEAGVQDARPNGLTQLVAPLVVKVGLTSRLQLELQGGYVRTGVAPSATLAGVADLAIAVKQRVLDAAPLVQDLALQGSIKFPSGGRDLTTGTTDVAVLVISSRVIGSAEVDLNAGYTHRSGDGSSVPINATLLTASLDSPLRGPIGGVAELFSYPATSGPAGAATMIGFLVGPTWQIAPSLVLDAGAIVNVRNMGGNAAYAGVTVNVGRLPALLRHANARPPATRQQSEWQPVATSRLP